MKEIELSVNKANVYTEVAKTTAYTGSKMQDDKEAYSRIFATDEDREMLERFWVEACNGATELLKQFIVTVSDQPMSHGVELDKNYVVRLELSSSYDESLNSSIETSLFSYFVAVIVAKWYHFCNKGDAESYEHDAQLALDDVRSKIYYRKKPRRVAPKD